MALVKTAAEIMKGDWTRPVDRLYTRRANVGRKRQYPPFCQHCRAEPHHSKGLGTKCHGKWYANRSGPIQPFPPTWPELGPQPCREADKGCPGMTGTKHAAKGWCAACYDRNRRWGGPLRHSPGLARCTKPNCFLEHLEGQR